MKKIKKCLSKLIKTHYLLESMFAIIFFAIFSLEITGLIRLYFKSSDVVDIIVILLPTVITVISISLSLSNEKILNLKRREFAKLLNGWYYNFLVMIIDVIAIFALYTICRLTNSNISIIVIEVIAIFYACYFSATEIPVLLQQDSRIIRIIKRYYHLHRNATYEYDSFDRQENIDVALRHLLFKKGVKYTYLALKKDDVDPTLLDDLLSIQNNFLFETVKDSPFLKLGSTSDYKNLDVDLVTIIDSCFSGLDDLLSFSKEFNIVQIYGAEDKAYLMTRCLFCLHKLCGSFDLSDKGKEGLHKVMFHLVTISDKDDSRNRWRYSFLNSMMASTLTEGDMWFASSIRDYDYPGFIFSFDNNVTGFFYLIYCFYLSVYSSYLPDDIKTKIKEFVNKSSEGLNSDGVSWIQYAKRDIEMCNENYLVTFINSLLKIYSSSSETLFYVLKRKGGFIGANVENGFDEAFLFNVWLEMLIFNPYIFIHENMLSETLESLSPKNKEILVNVLSNEWINENKFVKVKDIGFLNFVGIKPNISENYGNKDAIKAMIVFREKYLKAKMKSEITNVQPDVLDDYKEKIKGYFADGMEGNPLIDKKISLKKVKKLYISSRIPSEGLESIIEQYKSLLKDFFYNHIRTELIKTQKPNMTISRYTLSKTEAEKVLRFKPEYSTSDDYLFSESGISLDKFAFIKRIKGGYLPRMLFWKDKAITANYEFDNENSIIRPLNNEEINFIIDNEYTMINGLYKYGKYGNEDKNSILISREELYSFLSKTIYRLIIVFKAKVKINSSKLLWIKHVDEE